MKKIILVAVLGASISSAHAQLQNNGNLQIHTGGAVGISGTFTNAATATLLNNGSLYAKSDVVNAQPSMAAGTGTLFLNGTAAQALSGAQPFHTFHLSSDNGAGITLNTNLSVSGVHSFVAGRIASSATPHYLVYNAGSSYTGASDANHVTGWVKKLGATDFTFPVGNGTYLRSTRITNLSATGEFNAAYGGATPNTANADLQSPIQSINRYEHWILNKISGGTAQVTLNWDHSKVQFPLYIVADIRTAQFIAGKWTSTGGTATGTPGTTGSITSTALTTFGRMAIGSGSFIVPLDFISITAQRFNGKNRVEWKTANEVGVQQYEVERSIASSPFLRIGTVAAKNERALQTYNYEDANPLSETVYYRVKSIDVDGATKYTRVVSISSDARASGLVLLQNPVADNIVLGATNMPYTTAQYRILNANGQVLTQGQLPVGGNGTHMISLVRVPSGTYMLVLHYGGQEFVARIVKQ